MGVREQSQLLESEMVKDTGVIMTRSVMSLMSGEQQDPEGEKEVTGGHGQHVQILTHYEQ